MKIIVTGGSGLVGNAFQKIKEEYDHSFVFYSSKDCDLLEYEKSLSKIADEKADCVIHLAANVGGLYKNINQKVSMFETNILINLNIVRICSLLNLKFVGCLSTCIFPDNVKYPITEDVLFDGPPHDSNYGYAYAKRMLEIHCKTYREQFNSDFRCFIPTNLYGPFDNFNLQDAHVIPSLIHRCYLSKKNNEDFIVYGTGKPLRQFMHSEDFARIILNEFDKPDRDPKIICPKEEYSIGDIATMVANSFNYEDRIVFDSTKSDGQFKKTAISKINYNFKDIKIGIKETVDWFIKNYESIKK